MSTAHIPHLRFSGFESLEVRRLMSTYYMAPGGSDSAAGSNAAPFGSFSKAYSAMSGGDTLIVKNGTYNQQQVLTRSVRPPSGSSKAYTIVKAESPGGVVVDGKGTMSPISMDGAPNSPISFIQIDGIVFRHQGYGASLYQVDHIKFTHDGFEDASDGNSMTFVAGKMTSYILVEDSFAWGSGRYKFATYHADHVIFRRTVARFDRAVATPDPIAIYAIYASDRVELQNTIAIDSDHPEYWLNVNEYSGAYSIPSTDGPSTNINITGALALNVDMQFGTLTKNLSNINISNSVGWHLREGVLARDSANYNHLTLGDLYGPARQTQTVGMNWVVADDGNNTTSINNSILMNIKGTALTNWSNQDYNDFYGNSSNTSATGGGSHSVTANPGVKYILSTQGASSSIVGKASDGTDIGANLIKRIGVTGTQWGDSGYNTVTGEDLWPWPNQDIIATFMRSYSYQNLSGNRGFAATGQTLTNYVWNYLGNGNPYANSNGNPDPDPGTTPTPTPDPEPTAPSAPSTLVATATGSASVALKWNDNSSDETSFLIERQTGSGSFTQIAAVGAGVKTYTDNGLSAGVQYTYRVRANNSVGNSGYSNTSTATTIPPQSSSTPLTITSAQFKHDQNPNALVYQFSADVLASLNLPDVSVVNQSTGQSFSPTSWSWNASTKQATFKFAGALPNGNYRATFRAGGVWDSAGNTLSNAHTLDFYALIGDINRDRMVDLEDLNAISAHWKSANATFSDGDLTGDQVVDGSDVALISGSWHVQVMQGKAPESMTGTNGPADWSPSLVAGLPGAVPPTTPPAPDPTPTPTTPRPRPWMRRPSRW